MEKITSRNNNLIKLIRKLSTSHKERAKNEKFVLEGARLCFDALNSDYSVEWFLVTKEVRAKYPDECEKMVLKAKKSYEISADVAKKLALTETTQGVFAVCNMQGEKPSLGAGKKYLALDSIQDPSNLGALSRTAEAIGADGMIVYNSCDIFNPKTLRASMGSLLRLPVIQSENLVSDIENAKALGFSVYASVPDSTATDITTVSFNTSSIVVIGNEGNGISDEVKNASTDLVTIKMLGKAESLNASVAGALVMWEMLRGS